MTVFAVRVAMIHLFFGRVTDSEHFDVEVESHASEGMIAVDVNFVTFEAFDREDHSFAVAGVGFELHTDLKVHSLRELAAVDREAEARILFAVTFGGSHNHFLLISHIQAFQSFFKPRHNLAGAMKISERVSCIRLIQLLALGILQNVT